MFTFIIAGETLAPWVLAQRTGVVFVKYKKGDKEDIANYRPFSLIF